MNLPCEDQASGEKLLPQQYNDSDPIPQIECDRTPGRWWPSHPTDAISVCTAEEICLGNFGQISTPGSIPHTDGQMGELTGNVGLPLGRSGFLREKYGWRGNMTTRPSSTEPFLAHLVLS